LVREEKAAPAIRETNTGRSVNKMKISYVLCTRNRPENIRSLVRNLLQVDHDFDTELIVVDSSEEENLSDDLLLSTEFRNIRIISSQSGLPFQRNVGLTFVTGELVVFLDDDVIIQESLCSHLINAFQDRDVVGAAPLIKGLYLGQTSFLDSRRTRREGRLTKAGVNNWFTDSEATLNKSADWLPGCAMAYRVSAISDLIFSTALQNGPAGGYSLGEDVDFSLRASRRGKLICLTSVKIDHFKAPGVRDQERVMNMARGRWLAYLTRNFPEQVSSSGVILRLLVIFFYQLARSLASSQDIRKTKLSTAVASAIQIKFFMAERVKPILIDN